MARVFQMLALVCFLFQAQSVFAADVVIGGKLFQVVQKDVKTCPPSPGSLALTIPLSLNTSLGVAACKLTQCELKNLPAESCDDICSESGKWVLTYAFDAVFSAVREYPPFDAGKECEAMRDTCVQKCEDSGMYSSKKCFVKCHVYNAELFK
jgi:hypothetical protein